jgi:DNA/RNA-binding domain of Phe-tRNA-synthetase-like protein
MLIISANDAWRKAHPGAIIGLLELSGVENTVTSTVLEVQKRKIEARLRERYNGFGRKDFLALPVMAAYERYYKQFNKTYHVLLQIESIVIKEKNLPNVSPLVDANFMAEVETFVLTAGHDADLLSDPVLIDVSREGDEIIQMNGNAKVIRAGDMIMKDANSISCSIIYGQDNRSPITSKTCHVLYVAYAPVGVPADKVELQLHNIESNIRIFSPDAVLKNLQLLRA